MRYAYGVTTALLLGGAAVTLATGYPAGAQVAQNEDSAMARMVPRAGAPTSFADLTEQLQPAVVNISTTQRVRVPNNPFAGTPLADRFGPSTREGSSLGSGFLISADGYIVTNNHVVVPGGNAELTSITVTLVDGTEYEAELVGRDPASDLAVLKINRSEAFPFVKFGDSSKSRVGDWVIAIGNPFGLGSTVTAGIISAVHRVTGIGPYDRFIQSDVSINRGNSGGPMFDLNGNVIGVNSQILSPTGANVGIGFAIPASEVEPIVNILMKGERVQRGYLGVAREPVSDDLADSLGLAEGAGEIIQQVLPDGAAANSGVKEGDIVLSIDGQPITRDNNLSFVVARIAPGKKVPVVLLRRGKRQTVQVTIGERPTDSEIEENGSFGTEGDGDGLPPEGSETGNTLIAQSIGLQVVPLTPTIARQLRLEPNTEGLVIAVVDPNSDAYAKGLRRGDVILTAQYEPVSTEADLEAAIENARSERRAAVLLRIKRSGIPPIYRAVRIRSAN